MAKPELRVVDGGASDVCGEPTKTTGAPCKFTPADKCPHHGTKQHDGPDPPKHLGPEGRDCWNQHVTELEKAGVLDQIDLSVLEKACEVYEAGKVAWKAVQKLGPVVKGRGDSVKKNPAVSKHLEYAKEYRQYAKEIGRLKASAKPSRESGGISDYL